MLRQTVCSGNTDEFVLKCSKILYMLKVKLCCLFILIIMDSFIVNIKNLESWPKKILTNIEIGMINGMFGC